MTEKNKFLNYVIYGLELLLIAYLYVYSLKEPTVIYFKIQFFHLIAIFFSIISFIYHIKLLQKYQEWYYRIINIMYLFILIMVSYTPIMHQLSATLYLESYNRDVYNFSDNKKERFVINSFEKSCKIYNSLVYEKEIFPGIICRTHLTVYTESFKGDMCSNSGKIIKPFTTKQLDFSHFEEIIRNSEDKSFCHSEIDEKDFKIEEIRYDTKNYHKS